MSEQLPKHFVKLQERFPDVLEAVGQLGRSIREAGPLDEKQSQLIQLAAAAALKAEGSVHSHTKRALKAGVSPDEVRHALILLISTIGYPNVAAALSWADDILDDRG